MSNISFSQKIEVELIKLLYRQSKFALWPESFAAISLIIALWGVRSSIVLISWLVSNLLICGLARHILVYCYKRSTTKLGDSYENMQKWMYLFAIGAFLSGVSWGVAGSYLIVNNDITRLTFVIILLIGVISAANPLYSPMRSVYAAFLFPAFLPFAFWLIFQNGIFIMLGILAFVYFIIMLVTSFYSYKLIYSSLQLRFENSDLVESLSRSMLISEKGKKQIEKTLSLMRATLESTTDGILVVNAENKIEDFNHKFLEMWNLSAAIIRNQNIKNMINFVGEQLIDSNLFMKTIEAISVNPEIESVDELLFKDGRVFERYSLPQHLDNKCVGRVWSFRDVTRRKFLEAKLFHQAHFDALTELPNRTLVLDRLMQAINQAKKTSTNVAVMFLDLDRFKLINDTLGHALGDKLLAEVARRLNECTGENDTVSRAGGDEFLIILPALQTEAEIIAIARKCLNALNEPFIIDNNKFNSTISIGISTYPRDGQNAETLIRNADIAMYRAKELGRNNFQFFTEEMNQKVQKRLKIENLLREALHKDEFILVYQPIVSLKTKRVVGVEALMRWEHPGHGLIPPSDFIPVAEETGMIMPLGAWVLRQTCKQIRLWREGGLKLVPVSVNLSARQIKQTNFLDLMNRILHEEDVEPKSIVFELTESIVMDDIKGSIELLDKIKEKNISIVIDDFGTGYSSLNYLKRLPVDKVKIDKSFIEDIQHYSDDAAITSAIIALAGKLNLKVIAEGVETKEQLTFLIKHHCDEIQGYYFSEPLNADAFARLLAENKEFDIPVLD